MGSIYIWAVYFYFFVLTVLPVQESRPSMKITKYKLIEDVSNRNFLTLFTLYISTRHKPLAILCGPIMGRGGDRKEKKG